MPLGAARVRRTGGDVTVVSVAVGVHWALEAAAQLEEEGVGCEAPPLTSA